jgi:L-threonylcarbamoyladenylate synthase
MTLHSPELGESDIESAVAALRSGSVVAVPTDTVYGLAVDPSYPGALAHLFALKARPVDVPVPVLVASRQQAERIADLRGIAEPLVRQFWPGALTLVVPRALGFDADLGGSPANRLSVGVRWPDHPIVVRLCGMVGPLAVTSANLHRSPPAVSALEVASLFPAGAAPAVVIDGGICDRPASTVVDCTRDEVRCLREGAIDWDSITGILQDGSSPGREGR